MTSSNPIVTAFDQSCRTAGFRKKSGTWRRPTEDVIHLLQLQKSHYGPVYYLNVGFWLTELEAAAEPKIHMAHLQARAEVLLPESKTGLAQLLDLREPIADGDRVSGITEFMQSALVPMVNSLRNVDAFRTAGGRRLMAAMMVTGEARNLIESSPR